MLFLLLLRLLTFMMCSYMLDVCISLFAVECDMVHVFNRVLWSVMIAQVIIKPFGCT